MLGQKLDRRVTKDLTYKAITKDALQQLQFMNGSNATLILCWLSMCSQLFEMPEMYNEATKEILIKKIEDSVNLLSINEVVFAYYHFSNLDIRSQVIEKRLVVSIAKKEFDQKRINMKQILNGAWNYYSEVPQQIVKALALGLSVSENFTTNPQLILKCLHKFLRKDYYHEFRYFSTLEMHMTSSLLNMISEINSSSLQPMLNLVKGDIDLEYVSPKVIQLFAQNIEKLNDMDFLGRYLTMIEVMEKNIGKRININYSLFDSMVKKGIGENKDVTQVISFLSSRGYKFSTEIETILLAKQPSHLISSLCAAKVSASPKRFVSQLSKSITSVRYFDVPELISIYRLASEMKKTSHVFQLLADESIAAIGQFVNAGQWSELSKSLIKANFLSSDLSLLYLNGLLAAKEIEVSKPLLSFLFLIYPTYPQKASTVLRLLAPKVSVTDIYEMLRNEDCPLSFPHIVACFRIIRGLVNPSILQSIATRYNDESWGNCCVEFVELLRTMKKIPEDEALTIAEIVRKSGEEFPKCLLSLLRSQLGAKENQLTPEGADKLRNSLLLAFSCELASSVPSDVTKLIVTRLEALPSYDFSTYRFMLSNTKTTELTSKVAKLHPYESVNQLCRKVQALLHASNKATFDISAFVTTFGEVIRKFSVPELMKVTKAINSVVTEDESLPNTLKSAVEAIIFESTRDFTINQIFNLLPVTSNNYSSILIQKLQDCYSALSISQKLSAFYSLKDQQSDISAQILNEIKQNSEYLFEHGSDFINAFHETNTHMTALHMQFSSSFVKTLNSFDKLHSLSVTKILPCLLRQGLLTEESAAAIVKNNWNSMEEGSELRQMLIKTQLKPFLSKKEAHFDSELLQNNSIFVHPAIPGLEKLAGKRFIVHPSRFRVFIPLYDTEKSCGLWLHPPSLLLSKEGLKGDYQFYAEIVKRQVPAFFLIPASRTHTPSSLFKLLE